MPSAIRLSFCLQLYSARMCQNAYHSIFTGVQGILIVSSLFLCAMSQVPCLHGHLANDAGYLIYRERSERAWIITYGFGIFR